MTRTEERLTDTLHAAASEMPDEALRPASLPVRPDRPGRRHRWATRLAPAAAAAVVVLIAVLALIVPSGSKPAPGTRPSSAPVASGPPASVRVTPLPPPAPALVYLVGNGHAGGWLAAYSTATHRLGRVIHLGVTEPTGLVVTPDGKAAYVLNPGGHGHVYPVNLGTGHVGQPIGLWNDATEITITPDGKTVYVLNSQPGSVTPISTTTNRVGPAIKLHGWGSDIEITPDSRTAYVAVTSRGDPGARNAVIPISTATGATGRAIPMSDPASIAITTDGRVAYVASGSGFADPATVTPVRTATGARGRPAPVGEDPVSMVAAPHGEAVYAASDFSRTVTPLYGAAATPGRTIHIAPQEEGIVISPDGGTVWVVGHTRTSRQDDLLVPVSLATGKSGHPVNVGDLPSAPEITPDGRTVFVASTGKSYNGFLIPVNAVTGAKEPRITLPGQPGVMTILPG